VFRIHYALCEFENIADTEYTKHDVFSEIESQYFTTKTKISDFLNEKPVAESAGDKTCCHNEYQRTDMPKIMLPEFDGNLHNWEDFRDMFIAIVHNDKTMPLIKKMHYLKGYFKGEASRIIRIKLSAEGYEMAWAHH